MPIRTCLGVLLICAACSGPIYSDGVGGGDGTYAWKQLTPAKSPPARAGHSMVQVGDTIVLFGGATSATSTPLTDTWAWDGITCPSPRPSSRQR